MQGINLGQNRHAKVCTSVTEAQPLEQYMLILYDYDGCYQLLQKVLGIFGWESVVPFISQCVSGHFLYKDHKWNNYKK